MNVEQEAIPPTRKWVKMDWNEFKYSLTTENIRIMDSMTRNRLEKCLDKWYAQIENAIDKHCPKRKKKSKDLNNPWWSGKLQNPRREIKALKKQNALWSTADRKTLLKEKIKAYQKDCLNAKKQDSKDFNTKQNSNESINILRKILEKRKKQQSRSIRKTRRYIYKPRARHTKISYAITLPVINTPTTNNAQGYEDQHYYHK